MQSKYETDFYAWALETASLLKDKKFEELDVESLIEELEDMGKSEKRSLISRLSLLISYLLKWEHQPGLRSNSWKYTIKEQRDRVLDLLDENPSFKKNLDEFLIKAYKHGVNAFRSETGLDTKLPNGCPYSLVELFDSEFFP